MKEQMLDDLAIEREKDITIRSHDIGMEYRYRNCVRYILEEKTIDAAFSIVKRSF